MGKLDEVRVTPAVLGKVVKTVRQRSNLRQGDVCLAMGRGKPWLTALEAGERLPLGGSLNVVASGLKGSAPSVIKLPTSALRQEGQGTAVWVLDEASMKVNSQVVQLGPIDGNEVVIAAGLKPGQKVVSAGVHVLSPGQKVIVYGAAALATDKR